MGVGGGFYAAGSYAVGGGVCVYGGVQHSLPVLLVGAGLTLYWAARSLECIAAAITLKRSVPHETA